MGRIGIEPDRDGGGPPGITLSVRKAGKERQLRTLPGSGAFGALGEIGVQPSKGVVERGFADLSPVIPEQRHSRNR